MNLGEVANELSSRLVKLFLPGDKNRRPYQCDKQNASRGPDCEDRLLFYEYFHGETGVGLGASHQTGWTALVAECLEHIASRDGPP